MNNKFSSSKLDILKKFDNEVISILISEYENSFTEMETAKVSFHEWIEDETASMEHLEALKSGLIKTKAKHDILLKLLNKTHDVFVVRRTNEEAKEDAEFVEKIKEKYTENGTEEKGE